MWGTKLVAQEMSDKGATRWWADKGRRQVAWLVGYLVLFGLVMAILALAGQTSVVLAASASAAFVLGCSYNLCNAESSRDVPTGSSRYSGVLEALMRPSTSSSDVSAFVSAARKNDAGEGNAFKKRVSMNPTVSVYNPTATPARGILRSA